MDSITHMALGACIGEAVLYKRFGRKALVAGAIAQSFPDIDAVASLWLPLPEDLVAHRGITHSFLFAVVAAMLLAIVVKKIFRSHSLKWSTLFFFFCFQMCLHDILDTCNAYGTRILEPFIHQRFYFDVLYVGDPLFSISLVVAFIALAFSKQKNLQQRRKWIWIGLLPSCLYLSLAIYNKTQVKQDVLQSLKKQQILYKSVVITPTPFNSMLWYIMAATDSGYVIGYRSVFDKQSSPVSFSYYPRNDYLLRQMAATPDVQKLIDFSDHYYTIDKTDDTLTLNIMRFGQVLGWQDSSARFAFQYYLNPAYDNTLVVQRGRFTGWNSTSIINMFRRIKGR